MPRRCALTGRKVKYGKQVSHSHRTSSRRFDANLQPVHLLSEALGSSIRLRVSTRALRTVAKKGGLDAYLMSTDDSRLPPEALVIKRRIRKHLARIESGKIKAKPKLKIGA
ncbi:MAG: 50S ribosomal protein L28 [Acidobacteriota bacterium]